MANKVKLQSEITWPECGYKATEVMITNAYQWFCESKHCHALLKPKAGDCCVFGSYGPSLALRLSKLNLVAHE